MALSARARSGDALSRKGVSGIFAASTTPPRGGPWAATSGARASRLFFAGAKSLVGPRAGAASTIAAAALEIELVPGGRL